MKKKLSIISVIISGLLLISCGAENTSTMDSTSSSGNMIGKEEVSQSESGTAEDYSESISSTSDSNYSNDERKIINKADITIETTKFDEGINSLESITSNLGGYIEASNVFQSGISEWSYTENRNGEFVIRIPKDKFQEFLDDSESFGTVTNKRVYGEDVSTQYYDREARLNVLQAQEERYLEILKEAQNIEDVLEVEKYLTDVRYEIENITGTLKHMDNLVDYATININITEVSKVSERQKEPTTIAEKIIRVFNDSLKSLRTVAVTVLLALIAIIPYAVIIGIVSISIYYIVKAVKKNKRNKDKKE